MYVSELVTDEEINEFWGEDEEEVVEEPIPADQTYKIHLFNVWKRFSDIDSKEFPCVGQDMYPNLVKKQREVIQRFCNNCSHSTQCAYLAVLLKEQHGVWGGLENKQLKAIVAQAETAKLYEYFDVTKGEQILQLINTNKTDY
jgi:hypothetical protein